MAAYNAAAALFCLLVAVMGDNYPANSILGTIMMILFMVVTFPAWLLDFPYTTATGGGEFDCLFLSPLIWGVAAFAIHKLVMKRRERKELLRFRLDGMVGRI